MQRLTKAVLAKRDPQRVSLQLQGAGLVDVAVGSLVLG